MTLKEPALVAGSFKRCYAFRKGLSLYWLHKQTAHLNDVMRFNRRKLSLHRA